MTSSPATAAPAPTAAPALPKPNSLGAWILASRPKTLVAGWAPVLVGSAIAIGAYEVLRVDRAVAALFVSVAIQVGTNLVNDAADHARGADTADRLGPPRAVALGLLDGPRVIQAGLACFAAAGLVGLWLASVAGWWLLIPGAVALLAGYLYTAGPKPLAYLGLGEIFVFTFFGIFATMGSAYVQLVPLNSSVWQFSLPAGLSLGLLAVVILEVNNLRDAPTDALVAKRTIAVRLGDKRTRVLIAVLLVGVYAVAFVVPILWAPLSAIVGGPRFWFLLIPVLSAPMAWEVWRPIAAGASGRALNPVLGRIAKLEAVFAALLAAGYLLVGALS